MTLDQRYYEGIYLVVAHRKRCERGSWVRIWGSGGFWTVFVSDTEDANGIWLPCRPNDLLVNVRLRASPKAEERIRGIARLYQYVVLEAPTFVI
ncbi:hypothetical protein R5M92_16095 (plasmid) [Halomonas sp. Bachu 37]|uniref:hypothetical protein n=1 Tax=Halomonas kashgarensis TaxID=3084920 RepID=UPI003216B99A